MGQYKYLALDLGAESGRAVVGHFTGERLELEEVHRFANGPVRVNGTLRWDALRLLSECKQGMAKAVSMYGAFHRQPGIGYLGRGLWSARRTGQPAGQSLPLS